MTARRTPGRNQEFWRAFTLQLGILLTGAAWFTLMLQIHTQTL